LASAWRPGVERAAEERAAADGRLARHLFDVATTAAPGKEVRVMRLGDRLAAQRRQAWDRWFAVISRTRVRSALWHSLGWAIFGTGYVAAVVFVTTVVKAPAGDVLLVLAAGARLSAYVGAAVGEIGFLRGVWLDGSQRLAWLEDYAAKQVQGADGHVPERLNDGIRLESVSFAYPGTDRQVLADVDLHLLAGSVVAIVGENGAGKTTLIKLLCRLYQPTLGRILIDGSELTQMAPDRWRSRLSGAFQDFFRFEFRARDTIGLGDVPRLNDLPAIAAAVDRAGAGDVVEQLASGLETQLGPTWPQGAELSFGQWQKLALARGFMRDAPLLLVLDEPTAALDAETEHALFQRFASASRHAGNGGHPSRAPAGRITILVSHRFSTVRMADFIVVLDGARVIESGSHDGLMAKGGRYAELYGIQAAAYR
jgi:ATP-binding cassette subfamily B protein